MDDAGRVRCNEPSNRVEVRLGEVVLSGLHGGADADPVVVLLPGLAGGAEELRPPAEALSPRHQVIAVDQRGHGYGTHHPSDVSREAYVDDVVAVIDDLAEGDPVTLVGQSLSGHTARSTAARHSDRVSRLMMAEAGVGAESAALPSTTRSGWGPGCLPQVARVLCAPNG